MSDTTNQTENIEFRDNLNVLLVTWWIYLNDMGDVAFYELTPAQRTKVVNYFIKHFIE